MRLLVVTLTLLALLAPAVHATEPTQAEGRAYVTAEGVPANEAGDDVLELTPAEVEADYPVIADAIRTPDAPVEVPDEHRESTRAFRDRMEAYDALEVDGLHYRFDYTVEGTGTQEGGRATPVDDDADVGGADVRSVPALGALTAAAAVAGLARLHARRE